MAAPSTPPALRPPASGTHGAVASVSRRRLARHAAWAVPALVVATAAPAVAASTPTVDGLNYYTINCPSSGSKTITVQHRSTENRTWGLWISNVPAGTAPTSATFTIYVPTGQGANSSALTWSTVTSSAGWSALQRDTDVAQIAGYFADTSTYSGSWTFANRRYTATSPLPTWRATRAASSTCSSLPVTLRRTITWNSRTYTATRATTIVPV